MRIILIISSFLFIQLIVFSQEKFQNPMRIPMYLSGSFAELRSNHFHSGIDIKTNEKVGEPIYAIADGWVSRIKVSPWGFGLAVYVDHPSGYTSVYAHLNDFNEILSAYVLKQQYINKSYSFEKYFKKGEFPVNKDEPIGFSGNSGGSFGPHLHFEIRTTKNQEPMNPLMFDFDIKDTINPKFSKLILKHGEEYESYAVDYKDGIYLVRDTVLVYSKQPKLEVVVGDVSNGSASKLGVNKIQMFVGEKLKYQFENQKFSFSQKRYINAHIDYSYYKQKKFRAHKLFIEPGNKLKSYKSILPSNYFLDSNIAQGEVLIFDSKGNKSQLKFIMEYKESNKSLLVNDASISQYFSYNNPNVFENESLVLNLKSGTLYKDLAFRYKEVIDDKYLGGKIFVLHNEYVPLHRNAELRLKIPQPLLKYGKQLCLLKISNNRISSKSSSIENAYLKANIRALGQYTFGVDSIPPQIKLLSMNPDYKDKAFVFKITDDLSGIASYKAMLNGSWILFKYDYKTNQYYYDRDHRLKALNKEQELVIEVFDDKGNRSELKKVFYY